MTKPYIPLLKESNARTGFFELDQFQSVVSHLPDPIRPVVKFAYVTGWRIPREVLTLQWRQVDFGSGQIRLDPGTTKNGEGRVFLMTAALRRGARGAARRAGPAATGTRVTVPLRFSPERRANHGVHEGVENCLRQGRLSGPYPARSQAHRGPKPGPRRSARARGDADDRAQNALGVRAIQHR